MCGRTRPKAPAFRFHHSPFSATRSCVRCRKAREKVKELEAKEKAAEPSTVVQHKSVQTAPPQDDAPPASKASGTPKGAPGTRAGRLLRRALATITAGCPWPQGLR